MDTDQACLFCDIVSGKIPSKIVYRDKDVVAFEDINPQAPTHILIIPVRHIPSVLEIGEADSALLGHIYRVVNQLVHERGLNERGFRLVINSGPDSGQAVPHLHFHLIGGRKLSWPPG